MNKKWLLGLAALMLAVLGCSTLTISPKSVIGSGNVTSESRSLTGFDSIDLQGSGDVSVTIGSNESVVVETDDNILPLIVTRVENGTLVISTKDNTNITTRLGIHITVSMKSLKDVTLSGSGNIQVNGVTGGDFSVRLPGSGNITVEGSADNVDIGLPGSGNIYCEGLQAKKATVNLNGSGIINVYASESLEANLRGSGEIRYSGNPSQVNKSVAGSGNITP